MLLLLNAKKFRETMINDVDMLYWSNLSKRHRAQLPFAFLIFIRAFIPYPARSIIRSVLTASERRDGEERGSIERRRKVAIG